jgi:hypothetical protein
VAHSSERWASDEDDEDLLYSLTDWVSQEAVAQRDAPLLSARLTHFDTPPASGDRHVAVLTISVAHVAMDGGALVRFAHAWAATSSALRDSSTCPPLDSGDASDGHGACGVAGIAPPEATRLTLVSDAPTPCPSAGELAQSRALDVQSATVTAQLLRDIGEGGGPRRFCVHLPGEWLKRLKAAALLDGGDGHHIVSTQEALAAHMLRVLWRLCGALLQPACRVRFWLDGRRYLKGTADSFGNWTVVHNVAVSDARAPLASVVAQVSAGLRALTA